MYWFRSVIAVLLCLAVVGSMTGPARAQTDLQNAKDEAEEAKADAASARADVRIQRAQLDEVGTQLAIAFAEYTALTEQLEELTFSITTIADEIGRTERELANARDQALEQAVEVYTSAIGGAGLLSLFVGTSPAQSVIAAGVLEDMAQSEKSFVADYEALRADLSRRRVVLDEKRVELAAVRSDAEEQKLDLESLYASVQKELAAAEARVRDADQAYAKALDTIEKERRRLAMLRGAESWRPVVEIYFPDYLVDEALAIIQCESRGNPDAVNPTSGASGLFQFLASTWSWASVEAGWAGSSRFDPEANTAVAAWLVDVSIQTDHRWGRWGHWECRRVIYPKYTNGLSDVDASGAHSTPGKLEEAIGV